ncbi:MAG: hypothetical protein UR31_C0004G0004 [Parcubacteria group bacterium GW2011_GWA2_33_14]|uniref:Glycosyl transferase family 1 domain-containing protein n=1 Tax=Candidatus Staskawiczbacteria bacterium RIFCSPHIGHO2_02_FULL_33_16 TaxID=1802204 RepID=A0A1G2HXG9_9BACT|nr:MAG: hypothetical protein UR31_C0004G0004 [Parcubacteria group bacterium GW2011_GWA2_33_14]OGZ67167.1 MAG: hypothetical protein A3D34_01430 [Candidatus Staskawiczbacteria bacterium RIFCSPHIGHO2_02_FULL_33_16]OGZ70723.1 MAG: hypothetical protein A2980_01345 [Candidatus Staskawiczbacteria bacterium RIFCSPLOWO2_01_FULL_33_13]
MKLLIIYHGGLMSCAKSIFREYAAHGVDLTVIVPSKIAAGPMYSSSGYSSYSINDKEKAYLFLPVKLRKPDSYGEGFKFFQLFFAIKKIKPDLIHVFDEYSSFYLFQTMLCRYLLFGKKIPVISYTFQNIPFKTPPFLFKMSLRFFKRIAYKILYFFIFFYNKKALNGVTTSNFEAILNIKNSGFLGPQKRIFWGIDFNIFFQKDKNLCREKLNIPKNITLVGYFGKLVQEKGVADLVIAASKINDCHLMFVGEGDFKEELVKLVEFLGIQERVYFYSSVNNRELVDYYNCLDVFVLASKTTADWKEQYGRVLVEAMACHIPVVGSSSGAIPEVLGGYPKSLIFKEGDVEDLVEKIKTAKDLQFPENFNIKEFLEKFSVENFVLKHMNFYKNIIR